MKINRHRHGANGYQCRATTPDAGVEHIGQRRQRRKVQWARRVVTHPEAGDAVSGITAVPGGRKVTVHKAKLVAIEPFRTTAPMRVLGICRAGDDRQGQILGVPGVTTQCRENRGGQCRLAILHHLDDPVLGGPVRTRCPRLHFKRSICQCRSKINREGHRVAQLVRMLQDGVDGLRRHHPAKRPNHVGVGRTGVT